MFSRMPPKQHMLPSRFCIFKGKNWNNNGSVDFTYHIYALFEWHDWRLSTPIAEVALAVHEDVYTATTASGSTYVLDMVTEGSYAALGLTDGLQEYTSLRDLTLLSKEECLDFFQDRITIGDNQES